MKLAGKITKILANFYYVQDESEKVWECFIRSRLLKEGKFLFVGDMVEIETATPAQGVIVNLLDRKNKIAKPPIANIDQVLVVFSTCEPEFDFYNLDRYLSYVSYEMPDVELTICINKMDLKRIDISKTYQNSGFNVSYVSALTKEGLDNVIHKLINKSTVLTGPSGVGKSSLIKALAPDEDIGIGPVSATGSGKHKTRSIKLVPIKHMDKVGFLVDTPGFTQFSFAGLEANKLLATFKELRLLQCNFNDCLHIGENGCKLNDPNELESISETRLQSYHKILEELQSEHIYGKKEESKVKLIGKNVSIPKINQYKRTKSRKRQKQKLLKFVSETDDS